MARIWNISDHPGTTVTPQIRAVFGRMVPPGKFVVVPDELLDGAAKFVRETGRGQLYVGDRPPADYLIAKGQVHMRLPRKAAKGHGPATSVVEPLVSTPKAAPVESVPSTPEISSDTEYSWPSEKKRKKVRG